jgi:hypothetical protein
MHGLADPLLASLPLRCSNFGDPGGLRLRPLVSAPPWADSDAERSTHPRDIVGTSPDSGLGRLENVLQTRHAAFNTKSGELLGKTAERHTSAGFVAFLTRIVS